MTYCEEHGYSYVGEECPACKWPAQGQCREDDTTLVIGEATDVTIEDVSLEPVPEHRRGVGTTLENANAEFSGSFTVEFEDEDDAREFWEWLHNGTA